MREQQNNGNCVVVYWQKHKIRNLNSCFSGTLDTVGVLRLTERSSSDSASENSARLTCWLNVGHDTDLNSNWRLKEVSIQFITNARGVQEPPHLPPPSSRTPPRHGCTYMWHHIWIGQQIKHNKRLRFSDEKQHVPFRSHSLVAAGEKPLIFFLFIYCFTRKNMYLALHIVSSPATYMCHTMCFAEHKCQRPPFFSLYTYQCPHRHSCAHKAQEHCG